MTIPRLILVAAVLLLCLKCHLDNREFPVEGTYSGPSDPARPEAGQDSIGRVDVRGPGGRQFSGGTNFLVEHKGALYLVGAYHVLRGVDDDSQVKLVSVNPELAEMDPHALDVPHQAEGSYGAELSGCRSRGDMAVLRVKDSADEARPLELGHTPPVKGQPLWILQLKGGAGRPPTGSTMLRGVVAYHSNQLLALKMDKASDVTWTSGAPVLDAEGRVVGVNIGTFSNQDGSYRVAVPTETLSRTFAEL